MKLANILEENTMLFETHLAHANAVVNDACTGLNALQETIVRGIFSDLLSLTKTSLLTPHVDSLVENKHTLNSQQLVETTNEYLNSVDKWKTTPGGIADFSDRFAILENRIFRRLGESATIKASLDKLHNYGVAHSQHNSAILGVLASTASVANGSNGHIIAETLLSNFITDGEISNTVAGANRSNSSVALKPLSEGQVYYVFDTVCELNNKMIDSQVLAESVTQDDVGRRYTTVKSPKELVSAWYSANQPLDSNAVAVIIGECGINGKVVHKVFESMHIPLNDYALVQLNEGPFGDFLAKGATKLARGAGALAGGVAGLAKPAIQGFKDGRASVHKAHAADQKARKAEKAAQKASGAPAQQPQAAPAAPVQQPQAAQAQQATQTPSKPKQTPNRKPSQQIAYPQQDNQPADTAPQQPAKTGDPEFDDLAGQISNLDKKTQSKLLTMLQQQARQPAANKAPAKQPSQPKQSAASAVQQQSQAGTAVATQPAKAPTAQLPAPAAQAGTAVATQPAKAPTAQLPAPAAQAGTAVATQPAKAPARTAKKYNTDDAEDAVIKTKAQESLKRKLAHQLAEHYLNYNKRV